jgi:hypothetical protein
VFYDLFTRVFMKGVFYEEAFEKEFFVNKRLRRTKRAGAVLGAVLLAAMLVGCNEELSKFFGLREEPGDFGDGGDVETGGDGTDGTDGLDGVSGIGDETDNHPPAPILTFYVHRGERENADGSETSPFGTLAEAYDAAIASPPANTIVVLSNLDVDAAMTLTGTSGSVITITSGNEQQTLTRSSGSNGSVVEVKNGAKVLFSNIEIASANHRALYIDGAEVTLGADAHLVGKVTADSLSGGGVYIQSGTLTMKDDSKIEGDADYPSFHGGGVYVSSTGIFMMEGGVVSGNAIYGGGVSSSGTFTMKNGEISGCSNPSVSVADTYGGAGVFVGGGRFTMCDGDIKGNTYHPNTTSGYSGGGGGVFVGTGEFFMEGGTISGNTAESVSGYGGGVYVYGGTFTMRGTSTISGNYALRQNSSMSTGGGGGVYVGSGTFTMKEGEIEGNSALNGMGGGVYVSSSGTFTMDAGTISSTNTAGQGNAYYDKNNNDNKGGPVTRYPPLNN